MPGLSESLSTIFNCVAMTILSQFAQGLFSLARMAAEQPPVSRHVSDLFYENKWGTRPLLWQRIHDLGNSTRVISSIKLLSSNERGTRKAVVETMFCDSMIPPKGREGALRVLSLLFLGAAIALPNKLRAAEQITYGAEPNWISAVPIPTENPKDADQPAVILLSDEQVRLSDGMSSTFERTAIKIQKPEGLAAGNISFDWDPARDSVTVNRLEIHRNGQVVDVLKSGQQFTVVRREPNLAYAELNGRLTANIQPEDLREGDTIVLAMTLDHRDPVLHGHVETVFANWTAYRTTKAHARLLWPSTMPLQWKQTPGLPPARTETNGDVRSIDFDASLIQPDVAPRNAPLRYSFARLAEASDFSSWAQLSDLLEPLYRKAQIPKSGSLRDEVEKIRAASSDPKVRAASALQLVQQRIRYVALLLNQGALVPATPEETWLRRFGDCKAKTALLLAMLQEFGINSDPVLVSSSIGDALPDRLPMIGLFDHVLVRARIDGKDFWLDGTGNNDSNLIDIPTPNFKWGLPLANHAALVKIVPAPLDRPALERRLNVDLSQGLVGEAPFELSQTFRGTEATGLRTIIAAASAEQREEFARAFAKEFLDNVSQTSSSIAPATGSQEVVFTIKGTTRLDWDKGTYWLPLSQVGFDADFQRPSGRDRDVPFAIDFPTYERNVVTFKLPPSYANAKLGNPAIDETLAGISYHRTSVLDHGILVVDTSKRALAPEVPAAEARAAEARLKLLANEDIALRIPNGYVATPTDMASGVPMAASGTWTDIQRAFDAVKASQFETATKIFDQILAKTPNSIPALTGRLMLDVQFERWSTVEREIAQLEPLSPQSSMLGRARVLLAASKGDQRAAAKLADDLLKRTPVDDYLYFLRAKQRFAINDWQGAIADTDTFLAKVGEDVDARLLRANAFMRSGDKARVAGEAEEILAKNPQSAYAHVVAGSIFAKVDRDLDALKAYDQAIALEPSAIVYGNRSRLYPRSNRAARRADLEKAIAMAPNDADFRFMLADLDMEESKFAQAIDQLTKFIAKFPDDREAPIRLSIARLRSGDEKDGKAAIDDFRAKARSAADYAALCAELSRAGLFLNDAIADCRRAIVLSADDDNSRLGLAVAQVKLTQNREAIATLDPLLDNRPTELGYIARSIARERLGDHAGSQSDYAKALARDSRATDTAEAWGLAK
jgi:tetratricopeptide (TPR) repeat protein